MTSTQGFHSATAAQFDNVPARTMGMELTVQKGPSNRTPTVSSPTQSADNPYHRFHRLHQGIDFTLADDRGKAAHASRSQYESMIEQSQM